eukprot:79989-Chlamydomonas_euryale.AAC.5
MHSLTAAACCPTSRNTRAGQSASRPAPSGTKLHEASGQSRLQAPRSRRHMRACCRRHMHDRRGGVHAVRSDADTGSLSCCCSATASQSQALRAAAAAPQPASHRLCGLLLQRHSQPVTGSLGCCSSATASQSQALWAAAAEPRHMTPPALAH